MFANCQLGGMDIGFPDVCLTPIPTPAGPVPTPIPYPNMATRAMALPPTANLRHFISFMPAHNMATTIPMTAGDNAGCMPGGVASGMMMGPGRNLIGSVKVFTGGMPATTMLKPTLQNLTNCPGVSLVPSQFKVMMLG
ncbi:MAG: DUF4150 domain-containing protein [Saccharospirillaceae bacterium]|nr:DUF4150 domain-containing protein [Saccharospirillaceae bacterium]